jgi:hypothetical protein
MRNESALSAPAKGVQDKKNRKNEPKMGAYSREKERNMGKNVGAGFKPAPTGFIPGF